MPTAPDLLNADGSASLATALLMTHHGLRRDIALFAIALRRLVPGDKAKIAALREEWRSYCGVLHGHHGAEDANLFPHLRTQHPALGPVLDGLSADHRRIGPLLEHGKRAFGELPAVEASVTVVAALSALLQSHLATEEAAAIPLLRPASNFPPPASEQEADLHAQGFAWSCHGIAPDVLEKVYAMLPEILRSRLPAARAVYARRCERVWGTTTPGASRTAIPDWLLAPG